MQQFMMAGGQSPDLTFHACDFAFDDCSTPHLPDAGDAVLTLRQLRKALGAVLLPVSLSGMAWRPCRD